MSPENWKIICLEYQIVPLFSFNRSPGYILEKNVPVWWPFFYFNRLHLLINVHWAKPGKGNAYEGISPPSQSSHEDRQQLRPWKRASWEIQMEKQALSPETTDQPQPLPEPSVQGLPLTFHHSYPFLVTVFSGEGANVMLCHSSLKKYLPRHVNFHPPSAGDLMPVTYHASALASQDFLVHILEGSKSCKHGFGGQALSGSPNLTTHSGLTTDLRQGRCLSFCSVK
jgi:hypothetical protein